MKKFLFAVAAFAMALTASAETKTSAATISAELITEEIDGATAYEALLSLSGNAAEAWTAFQMAACGSDGVEIVGIYTTGDGTFDQKSGRSKVFTADYANYNKDGNVGLLFSAFDQKKTGTTVGEGECLLIEYKAEKDGTINLIEMGGAPDDVTFYAMADATIDVKSTSTAVKGVSANENAAGPSKYLKNGTVVIKKGNKQYNAAGAELK